MEGGGDQTEFKRGIHGLFYKTQLRRLKDNFLTQLIPVLPFDHSFLAITALQSMKIKIPRKITHFVKTFQSLERFIAHHLFPKVVWQLICACIV